MLQRILTGLWGWHIVSKSFLPSSWITWTLKTLASERTNPLTCAQPLTVLHSSFQRACLYFLSPALCLCNSQYIWLTWWTAQRAKVNFWVHGSHGNVLWALQSPSGLTITLAWLTAEEVALLWCTRVLYGLILPVIQLCHIFRGLHLYLCQSAHLKVKFRYVV